MTQIELHLKKQEATHITEEASQVSSPRNTKTKLSDGNIQLELRKEYLLSPEKTVTIRAGSPIF